jgi:type III pantothenate kinase
LISRVLAIDRGNHSVKGALFEGGELTRRWREAGEESDISAWIGEARPDGAAVSTVVPSWKDACGEALASAGVEKVVFASSTSDWPFTIDLETPETVGADRLCAAAGAFAAGTEDAVIVDAGSAVTVDILRGGVFLGGAIMPGLAMMLRSLSEETAALPGLAPGADLPGLPGRDTESAIRAGTAGAFIGGIERLISIAAAVFDDPPPVFLTGGDAGLLIDSTSPASRHYPDLVLEGLKLLYNRKFG